MNTKKKEKWIKKIFDSAVSRRYNIKKYPIYYNSEEINAKCIKIKTVDDYKSIVEYSTLNNDNEWYLITAINKISKSKILENKEYIFTNSKNMIEHIIKDHNISIPINFSNIFIAPKGTTSFFGIEIEQRLWIK